MRPALRRWGHGALAMSFVFAAAVLPVRASPVLDLRAELGVGGWIVPGRFAPLRVEVRAAREVRGILEIELRGAAGERTVHAYALRVPPAGSQQLTADVLITDPRRGVVVRVVGERAAEITVPVGATRAAEGIVAAVTREQAGLEFLRSSGGKLRPAYLTTAELPTSWHAYEAVDLLVVRDLDARVLLPSQEEALLGWLAQGGRLLVSPGGGAPPPGWLRSILPAEIVLPASLAPGTSIPVVGLRATPGAEVFESSGRLLAVRGRYGRGVVEVWAFDPFSPAGRVWPGRLPRWRSLLGTFHEAPPVTAAIAEELPRTRPLPGSTQLVIALLSVGYIVLVRFLLRRFGAASGGWAVLAAAVAAAAIVLYGSAAGARRAAGSIAQVTIIEGLEGTARARALTLVSLIAPYGGGVDLALPAGAGVRALGAAELRISDGTAVSAAAPRTEPGVLEVSQIVPFDLQASAVEVNGALELRITGKGRRPSPAVLFRSGQAYRLGEMPGERAVLDPARWEGADRVAGFGSELTARAAAAVFKRLADSGGDGIFLVGETADEAVGVRLKGGGRGQWARLVVIPVELRR